MVVVGMGDEVDGVDELGGVVTDVVPDPTPTTVPGKPNSVPVTLRYSDRSPLKVVRPRFSACWATLWGIVNCVCRLVTWNWSPSLSEVGEIDPVVTTSLTAMSPTGVPGQ